MVPHMHGIKPLGVCYASGHGNARDHGLGLLAVLGDEVVLELLGRLPPADLIRMSATSRALYCFCNHEDLWKAITLQELGGKMEFQASWKDTYLHHHPAAACSMKRRRNRRGAAIRSERRLSVTTIYSDVLFQPHLCRGAEVPNAWLQDGTLPRAHASAMPSEAFLAGFVARRRPVIITGCAELAVPRAKWSQHYLETALRGRVITAGNMEMAADRYFTYLRRQRDDAPLYLFDPRFAERAPALAADFSVPHPFASVPDLFALLGESARPDYRWLIVGPDRSGSTFHVDPNATSAWNACVRGRKLWVMFPPGSIPPGVHPSADGTAVAAPVSVMEWLLNFFACARADSAASGCVWGVARPGDTVFVPHGWWHCVLNVGEAVAVTQNFVSEANLHAVLQLLQTRDPDRISGCPETERPALYDRFAAVLEARQPDLWARWEGAQGSEAQRSTARGAGRGALAGLFQRAGKGEEREDNQRVPFEFAFKA